MNNPYNTHKCFIPKNSSYTQNNCGRLSEIPQNYCPYHDNYIDLNQSVPTMNLFDLKMKSLRDYSNNLTNIRNNVDNSIKNPNTEMPSYRNLKQNKSYKKIFAHQNDMSNTNLAVLRKKLDREQECLDKLKISFNNLTQDINNNEESSFQTQTNFHKVKNKNLNLNINQTCGNNNLKAKLDFNNLLNSIQNNNGLKNNSLFKNNDNNTHIEKINNRKINNTEYNTLLNNIPKNSKNNTIYYRSNNNKESDLNKYQENTQIYNTNLNLNDYCYNTQAQKFFSQKDSFSNENNNNTNTINRDSFSVQISDVQRNTYTQNDDNISLYEKFKQYQKNKYNESNKTINNENSLPTSSEKLENSFNYNNNSIILNKPYQLFKDNNDKNVKKEILKIDEKEIKINNNKLTNKNIPELKDINGYDANIDNFIVTFGCGKSMPAENDTHVNNGNNSTIKTNNYSNEIKNGKDNIEETRTENTNNDNKINEIFNDYENLKKRYTTTKLINNTQEKNNQNNDNNIINDDNIIEKIKTNTITNFFTKEHHEFFISSDNNNSINYNKELLIENEKYKKEIESKNKELKESKQKIKELNQIIENNQKEISLLKDQIIKYIKDAFNNSENSKVINTNNNNTNTNTSSNVRTKIDKDSFLIKIPDNLITSHFKQNRNKSSLLEKNRNSYSGSKIINTGRYIQDKLINFNNYNYTNSVTNTTNNNDISVNTNTITNVSNIKEVYTKKITTTMKKKLKKSNSQNFKIMRNKRANLPMKLNLQTDLNLSIDDNRNYLITLSQRNNKEIYTFYPKNKNKNILCFEPNNKKFRLIDYNDFGNFNKSYYECFENESTLWNNLLLIYENCLYILTGKNTNMFYIFNPTKKSMNKLCSTIYNHTRGCLASLQNKILCLSGETNNKVEIFNEEKNKWEELSEMNISRCNFTTCVLKNRYIFALFGFSFQKKIFLDNIEFYDMKKNENWKFLNYNVINNINLKICGMLSVNYKNEKIFILGGFNGEEKKGVEEIYQLNLGKNLEHLDDGNAIIEETHKYLKNINKNFFYYFENCFGSYKDGDNNLYFTAFDNHFRVHVLRADDIEHEVYYFE